MPQQPYISANFKPTCSNVFLLGLSSFNTKTLSNCPTFIKEKHYFEQTGTDDRNCLNIFEQKYIAQQKYQTCFSAVKKVPTSYTYNLFC